MSPRTDYRERAPTRGLAPYVECFWTHNSLAAPVRVLPDTCVDVVFSRELGLRVVGAMTRALLIGPSQETVIGARLRAGAARSVIGCPVHDVRDAIVSATDLWGRRARSIEEELRNVTSSEQGLRVLESALVPRHSLSEVQAAIGHLAANGGRTRLDCLTNSTGLGPRHFRRRCLEETGLSPKHLARIGRFRCACSYIARSHRVNWADLAFRSGYYDQAHLINDFREFSGLTPNAYCREFEAVTVSSNTAQRD